MSIKEVAKYSGGVLLAALLLWWVFRGTDPRELWAQLGRASVAGLLLSAAINWLHVLFRVWRWRALLEPVRRAVPFRPLFAAVVVGYLTTWVIPGRLGELVRPMLLSAREGVALGPSVGTVVADRLLDAMTVVALFAVASWVTPLEGAAADYAAYIRGGSLLLLLVVVLLLGLMLVVSQTGNSLRGWLERQNRVVRWFGRALVSLSDGARSLSSPRLLLRVSGASVLMWLAICLATWVGIRASGAAVSFGACMVILPMLVLGVAVPTPAGAGSYHGAMKAGLLLFGVAELTAVGAGLLVHATFTVPIILVGTVLLWTERISWRDLVSAARQVRSLGAEGGGSASGSVLEGVP